MMRKLKNFVVKHVLREWPKHKIHSIIHEAISGNNCLGLFEGMQYISKSIGSEYFPKLLGTYEMELRKVFETEFSKDYDQFIDIGAAEGYYAVGAALKTEWDIVAFEADPHTPLPELAKLNQVDDRITLKGACDLGDLQTALRDKPNSLLLVDVETAELLLLDPHFIPELKHTTMIVEIHDCFIPGIGDRLLSRFQTSHKMDRIDCKPRSMQDCPVSFPKLPFDPTVYTLEYLDERRPDGMYWLIFNPVES